MRGAAAGCCWTQFCSRSSQTAPRHTSCQLAALQYCSRCVAMWLGTACHTQPACTVVDPWFIFGKARELHCACGRCCWRAVCMRGGSNLQSHMVWVLVVYEMPQLDGIVTYPCLSLYSVCVFIHLHSVCATLLHSWTLEVGLGLVLYGLRQNFCAACMVGLLMAGNEVSFTARALLWPYS